MVYCVFGATQSVDREIDWTCVRLYCSGILVCFVMFTTGLRCCTCFPFTQRRRGAAGEDKTDVGMKKRRVVTSTVKMLILFQHQW